MNIDFPIQLDILDFIFKGIAIGIIASAPMGPVGILCIQRTLNKGRWYGLMTGVGAAVSDIIYALIVGLGMGFIMEPLQNPKYQFPDICRISHFGLFLQIKAPDEGAVK